MNFLYLYKVILFLKSVIWLPINNLITPPQFILSTNNLFGTFIKSYKFKL